MLFRSFLEKSNNGFEVFNYTDTIIFNIVENLKINSLMKIKWGMSFVFILIFIVIGILFSKWNFNNINYKRFLKLYLFGGMVILILSFVIFTLGKLLNTENEYNFYFISLELSHFIQSALYPIVFILIFRNYSFKASNR